MYLTNIYMYYYFDKGIWLPMFIASSQLISFERPKKEVETIQCTSKYKYIKIIFCDTNKQKKMQSRTVVSAEMLTLGTKRGIDMFSELFRRQFFSLPLIQKLSLVASFIVGMRWLLFIVSVLLLYRLYEKKTTAAGEKVLL